MTYDDLKEKFPNASEQFLCANASDRARPSAVAVDRGEGSAPVVERRPRPRPLAKSPPQGQNTARFLVSVTSFRVRLLDDDNLCEKYHVDCCRFANLLPDDAPGTARITVGQEKVRSKEEERTEILIERLT
jgi:hypothetical protein